MGGRRWWKRAGGDDGSKMRSERRGGLTRVRPVSYYDKAGANVSVQVARNKKRKRKDEKWRETPRLKKFVGLVSNFEG
jgi:hypothetical protein